ncbi:Replication factor C subunit 1 [Penicillium chermesinum]|uniref:Replication factor C subunit 1 n=1 Tax=Penicillium chermesinum TaxID=63820 RepID=A0A9W9NPK6_9EURO|nr:Replication factor C subunit 1 [Penicillium chermesinum]KAJ5223825.1 Replication factor C subunit 1 [Penicillium chermesinum]
MPSDIRNFFGGKPSGSSPNPPKKEDPPAARKRRSRKVVDDSDEDEEAPAKAPTPKPKAKAQLKPEEPKGEATSTSDYFASRFKKQDNHIPAKTSRAASKKVSKIIDEEDLGGDDIYATEYAKPGKGEDDYVAGDSDDDDDDFEVLEVKPATAASKRSQKKQTVTDEDDDVVMDDLPQSIPKTTRPGRKRKSEALLDEDEDEDDSKAKKPASRAKATKTTAAPAAKKAKASPKKKRRRSPRTQKSKPFSTVSHSSSPPSPPPESEKKKWTFGAQQSRTPPPGGNKEIPRGAENCLAGLTFVFTGVLETLGREEGQALTSFVVLGGDAGPSKLKTIAQNNLRTIDEDGLFELIRQMPANGGSGTAAKSYEAKQKAEEEKMRAEAAQIDAEEKKQQAAKLAAAKHTSPAKGASQSTQPKPASDELWTTKYAPTATSMICGNKGLVEKLQNWLRNWHQNAKNNFKVAGKDGSGTFRAVMIHGPPGIGKTTAAHLIAKLEGFDIIETNASDTRSKKLVESGTLGVLDTTSLQGYFAADGQQVERSKKNVVLIMDEVDGMSAGDRGGVGAVAAIVKKTSIPIILICNDRRLPKMKPFDFITYDLPFKRPTVDQIRGRLSTICFREGIKMPAPALEALIEGTHADIRQVINMLSAAKLDQKSLDYDTGKEMSKAWEKHVILKPWDIVSKILSAQMFGRTSKSSLNDKIELYFNDHEFSYLMLQENYLKTRPAIAGQFQGKEQKLKELELAEQAAASISDGDLVDRMIHGTQQQWSLMPTHACFSFVRPASFQYGNMSQRPTFASWLGQNSKQTKLSRFVKEIQGHMRLRTSGNRDEIRQQYMPLLWDKSVRRLQEEGKDSVESVIDFMDSYFLTRDDFDAMLELGLGPMDESNVKLESQTKATFTRVYNQRSHPLPFMKASNVTAPKKGAKEKPDIEDAIDESDEGEVVEEAKDDEDEELDLKKDKYVSQPKKKPAAKGKAAKKGKKAVEDDFIDDSEEKPKKGRKGKAKA